MFDAKNPACQGMEGRPSSGVLVSHDEGRTWRPQAQIKSMLTWLIEPAIVELRKWGEYRSTI